jgi:hypothetical protein
MSHCPTCGTTSPPCPETGYDGDDSCSAECEETAIDNATNSLLRVRRVRPQAVST